METTIVTRGGKTFTRTTDVNDRSWIEVSETFVRDNPSPTMARIAARVVRMEPAGFDGTFPAWCRDFKVAVDVEYSDPDRDPQTTFFATADLETGLAMIREKFLS